MPSKCSAVASLTPQSGASRAGLRQIDDVGEAVLDRAHHLVRVEPVGLPGEAGRPAACGSATGRSPGARNSAAHDDADRQHERVEARPGPEVEGDLPAGPDDPQRLVDERQGVVAVAVLQRDVAERDVGGVVGDAQAAAVGDLDRAQAVDLAEAGDGLPAALEEAGVEVAGVDACRSAG